MCLCLTDSDLVKSYTETLANLLSLLQESIYASQSGMFSLHAGACLFLPL